MTTPLVSVLLPVYNAQDYLKQSIDSILGQTLTDFELIIVNDGSTDGSKAIIDSYSDSRIIVIDQPNAGLPISLNRAIARARGKYLARQDADDVSEPTRLEKQVAFLDEHLDYGLLGTWARILEIDTITDRELKHPIENGELQMKLVFYNCFVHSSVMIRKEVLSRSGLYPEDPEKFPPEDFDLWLRIAQISKVANLPSHLLQYRELPESISRQKLDVMQVRARNMSVIHIMKMIGNTTDLDKIKLLVNAMCAVPTLISHKDYQQLSKLLAKIAEHQMTDWPMDRLEIEKGLSDCQIYLKLAYDKSRIRAIDQYLPFDLIALIKRFRQ